MPNIYAKVLKCNLHVLHVNVIVLDTLFVRVFNVCEHTFFFFFKKSFDACFRTRSLLYV